MPLLLVAMPLSLVFLSWEIEGLSLASIEFFFETVEVWHHPPWAQLPCGVPTSGPSLGLSPKTTVLLALQGLGQWAP